MEDTAIVDLYWQRSERAIAETQIKYGAYCRSIALTVSGSERDADECVNDTWLAAWNSMPDKRPSRLRTYLGCLTRHLAISRRRAERSLKRGGDETALVLDELAECVPSDSDPAGEVEARELGEAIRRFAEGLSEQERHAFLGRYWAVLPVGQIAARLGFSESRTKSLLLRLRKRLRRQLEEEGFL